MRDNIGITQTDKYEQVQFHEACAKGQTEIVKELMTKVDVNQFDETGVSTFGEECLYGEVEMVKLLMEEPRVDVNQVCQKGHSPLGLACYFKHDEVTRLLLANPRVDDNDLGTKCMLCVFVLLGEEDADLMCLANCQVTCLWNWAKASIISDHLNTTGKVNN
eukprot:gene10082-11158_t